MSFAMQGVVTGLAKLVLLTVIVMTLGSAAAVYLTPPTPQGARIRRQAEAQKVIDQVTHASWNYFHERGEFPPGDGRGTASLVRALGAPSASGVPFMTFGPDMITDTGDLRDPLAPRESVLHYRNNRAAGEGGHNVRSFDLWGRGLDGSPDGVNNWDGLIVSPP
jgi:hypothetical protein